MNLSSKPTPAAVRRLTFILLIVPLVSVPSEVFAQPLRGNAFRYGNTGEVAVFLPAPRELQRELQRAKADIAQEKYVDAITRLNLILGNDDQEANELDEDYFLPAKPKEPLRSLRNEAEELIGSLPPQGLEAYELAYGTEARQRLEDAVEQRDLEEIAEVSRRFGHTKAGQEATMILGRDCLLNGLSLEAVMHFRRLRDSKSASERFAAELEMLSAIALKASGREADAATGIREFAIRRPGAEIQVSGKSVKWFDESEKDANGNANNEAAAQWLTSMVGDVGGSYAEAVEDWRMFGGSPTRSAVTDVEMPARLKRWEVPFAIRLEEEKLLERLAKSQSDLAITPTLHPLVVDDWVLMRSADQLWGVELETGRRVWQYPWWKESEAQAIRTVNPYGTGGNRRELLVKQRVWQDALYGQLSSDGDSVYLLNRLYGDYYTRNVGASLTNELTALELQRQGYMLWVVGGADGRDEPALANVFFLGVPLPIDDTLYCLAELNSEIRLVALDKENGKLLWSQQLAHIDIRPGQDRGGVRRMSGLNLTHSDGILVCPTSVGGVVAVDLARRTFLWGFQYNKVARSGASMRVRSRSSSANAWRDNWTIIRDGKVVVTPWDSNELFCLDLLTGEKLWSKPQGSNIFVAGIHDGNVILVGKTRVSAVSLDKGENRWSMSLRDTPSGRGVQSGKHYLLATNSPELLLIDLDEGKVVTARATEEPLGNLVAARGHIVSQNPRRLSAFYQRGKLEQRVLATLDKNPNDPWALEHQAMLLLESGDRRQGLDFLRRAIANYPKDDSGADWAAKKLMVDTSLEMLRENVPGATQLAKEIEPFIARESSTQEEFLRVMTVNLKREGKIEEATRRNLELFQNARDKNANLAIRDKAELMVADKNRGVRRDRWHRALFRDLWDEADARQRDLLTEYVDKAIDGSNDDDQSQLIAVLQDIPIVHTRILKMIRDQIESGSTTASTESQLRRLMESGEAVVAARATALLADLYLTSGHYQPASETYSQLQAKFGDEVVRDGLTGAEISQQALNENASLKGYVERNVDWNYGKVLKSPLADDEVPVRNPLGNQQFDTLTRPLLLDTQVPDAAPPNDWQLVFDPFSKRLEARDGLGNVRELAGLAQALSGVRGRELQVRTKGNYIVCVRGESVAALNVLDSAKGRDEALLWTESGQGVGITTNSVSSVRKIRFGDLGDGVGRTVPSGRNGRAAVALGAVTSHGVILRRYSELMCLDLVSGEPVWVRSDIDLAADIWADDEHVFAHVPGIPSKERRNARVFSTLDGRELGAAAVPGQRQRVRVFGKYVLDWGYTLAERDWPAPESVLEQMLSTRDDEDYRVRPVIKPGKEQFLRQRFALRNVLTGKKKWIVEFGLGSRATFLNHNRELAIFEPSAKRLRVISVLDGSTIVDQPIEVSLPKVEQLAVEKRAGVYVVTISETTDGREKNKIVYRSPISSQKLANMEVYAFSLEGEPLWSVPAKLRDFVQAPIYAKDVPMLAFIRSDQTSRKRELDSVILDVRDGRPILEDTSLLEGQTFQVRADLELNQVQLRIPANNGKWKLDFSDEPRPPAPPYGYKVAKKESTIGKVFDLLRSLPSTIGESPADEE